MPSAARREATSLHNWLSTRIPWTNTTGGELTRSSGPAVAIVDFAVWQRDSGHTHPRRNDKVYKQSVWKLRTDCMKVKR